LSFRAIVGAKASESPIFVIPTEAGAKATAREEPAAAESSALSRQATELPRLRPRTINQQTSEGLVMFTFLLWCLLFVVCWPVALLALIVYPIVWLFLLPFRIVGVAVHGALELIFLAITLPFRLLAAPFRI
jgi:hypothetical protein